MRTDRIVPLIIAVALFMENMDSTVIATSLPAIAADIGTNPLALKLAVTSYLLSLAIFIPASGWTADRFGARTVFRAAIAVFVLGSIGCALSNSLTDFVIARIVQGMGGAMMTPVGRMVLVRTIPKRELVGAMAWVTTPALIGPVLGPPVGGFITTYATWHWIFIINVPIGLIGIVLATRYIPDMRAEHHDRFDLNGMVLAGLGIAGVAFGLSVLGLNFLPWTVVAALVVGGAFFIAAYLVHARHTANPALDLTLFRMPTFFASVLGGFIFRLGIGALPFLLPLMLQIGFGMTPFQSGLITFASAFGAMGMKLAAVTILRRFGFRTILVVNALVSAGFLAACATFTQTTPVDGHARSAVWSAAFSARCNSPASTPSPMPTWSRPRQPGDLAGQRRPAIGAVLRRRGRRLGGGTHRAVPRRRAAGGRRFPAGLPGGGGDFGAFGADIRAARARCRRGNGQPPAGADGNLRPAGRLRLFAAFAINHIGQLSTRPGVRINPYLRGGNVNRGRLMRARKPGPFRRFAAALLAPALASPGAMAALVARRADVRDADREPGRRSASPPAPILKSGRLHGEAAGVAYALRGLAYLDRGDIPHAIADLNQAITLAPDFVPAYQNRGNAWYARGNYGEAIADYDAAIRLDPNSPRLTSTAPPCAATSAISTARCRITRRRSASMRNQAGAYSGRGELYMRQQDYARAVADFDRAIRLDGSAEQLHAARAGACRRRRQRPRARRLSPRRRSSIRRTSPR